jgi:hypothetical protein
MRMLIIMFMVSSRHLGTDIGFVLNSNRNIGNRSREHVFLSLIESAFKNAGWDVEVEPARGIGPDLLIKQGPHLYVAEMKVAHVGRRDLIIPLLSMAILQAQAAARQFNQPSVPLAIVAAPRIPDSLAGELRQFAARYAPDVAVGLVDLEGFRAFEGPALQALNAERSEIAYDKLSGRSSEPSAHLFSDLNQWLLKVLLAKYIPDNMLRAPRAEYRNASQLAEAAGVSVMSAFRFVRQLEEEGFLEQSGRMLKLVRIEHLFHRWQAANLKFRREVPFRWILKGQSPERLRQVVRSYQSESAVQESLIPEAPDWEVHRKPHICLGLFSAADALGFGLVHGVPEHLYVEKMNLNLIRPLGLSPGGDGKPVDVYARVPSARHSVFRGAVMRDGVPVSDILQVWLDVSAHPARGIEQADEIQRRILNPLIKEVQA